MELTNSGSDVPIATMVSPTTYGGMPRKMPKLLRALREPVRGLDEGGQGNDQEYRPQATVPVDGTTPSRCRPAFPSA